jgi:hypothetical protein
MNPHTLKGASTLGGGVLMILECSESDFKHQNQMVREVIYTIEKLLKRRCLKWARMTHLDI